MADYTSIKNIIQEVVKTNDLHEITGANLQMVLLGMINAVDSNNEDDYTLIRQSINTLAQYVDSADDAIRSSIANLLNYVNAQDSDIRSEINSLANSLNSAKFGYNVSVFGLVAGVHTLATAVKNVPAEYRFGGQKITFKTDAGWVTYQNTSLTIGDYEDVDNWVLDSGTTVEGDVTITNNPDYEDLTQNEGGLLKFADKEYNAASYSGLGRVYLRKNIVGGVNTLTQEMISDANTIYHIQYDYVLGEDITIPENCVLEFDGGSISGGKLLGDIKNDIIHSSWFGDLSVIGFNLSNKTLILDSNLSLTETITLEGVTNFELDGKDHTLTCQSCDAINIIGECSFINIHNVKFIGGNDYFCVGMNPSSEGLKDNFDIYNNYIEGFRFGISLNADNAGSVENCKVHHNTITNIVGEDVGHGYGIHIAGANWCQIYNNNIAHCQRHSIYHAWGSHNRIENNYISHHRYGLSITNRTCIAVFRKSEFVTIKNNYITDCYSIGIHLYGSEQNEHKREGSVKYVDILNNRFINNASVDMPNILIGYGILDWSELIYHEDYINVSGNEFIDASPTLGANVLVYDAAHLNIENNTLHCGISRPSSIALMQKYYNDWNGTVIIKNNTVIPDGIMTSYGVIDVTTTLLDAELVKLIVNGNNLVNSRKSDGLNYKLYKRGNASLNSNNQSDALVFQASSKPTSGYFIVGDRIETFNYNNEEGFICKAAGNPGTWWPYGQNVMLNSISGAINTPPTGRPKGSSFMCGDKIAFYDNNGNPVDADGRIFVYNKIGTTANRPTNVSIGFRYFDTDLGKPIYVKDVSDSIITWVDATGTPV